MFVCSVLTGSSGKIHEYFHGTHLYPENRHRGEKKENEGGECYMITVIQSVLQKSL